MFGRKKKAEQEQVPQVTESGDAGKVTYTQGNGEMITIKLLESIQHELRHIKEIMTEQAYYLSYLETKKKGKKR